jgi:uncharacterized membrane protein YoaK (UPF0700 family)
MYKKPQSMALVQQTSGNDVPSLRVLWRFLIVECLFTATGGFLDAYAFIAHGQVFANAQTANVVLFSIYAIEGNGLEAVRHIPPIVACVFGVSAAKVLGARSEKHMFSADLTCQCIELFVLLFLVRFSSQLPNLFVVPIISFVAAMQMASFDTFGPWSFNSATTTGNIKSATVSIVLWLRGEDSSKNRGAAIVSVLACVAFLLGALFGGFYTRRHPTRALLPCVCMVLVAISFSLRQQYVQLKGLRSISR